MPGYIIDEDGSYLADEDGSYILLEDDLTGAQGQTMKIIEPITITDGMVGSGAGTVVEVEHPEWTGGTTYNALQKVIVKGSQGTFVDLVVGTKNWSGIAAAPNGDVYFAVYGGSIWKQTGGVGAFSDLVAGNKNWNNICIAPNGDIYACVASGSIWISTNAGVSFSDLGADAGTKDWTFMAAAPNGDIYAVVSSAGAIWKRTGGIGAFSNLGVPSKGWNGICVAPNGDVYANVYGGSIWKSTNAGVSFSDLVAGNKNWMGMAAAPNGDVYAAVYAGSIWKSTNAGVSFGDQVTGNKNWNSMTVAVAGDAFGIYASVYGGSIWVSTLSVVHKIYESLVAGNIAHYPPIDVRQTTPKWLEVSATNKWKVFDSKTTSQMQVASPAVYTITPGVAFDSVALLNLEATSVRIQVDAPVYDETVATGISDVIKADLVGGVASVLTITITNTAGLAKVGEIIIGNSYIIGNLRPFPNVGITDYSTKTQDVFGDWTIIPRSYSEKMNCAVNVAYDSLDGVIAKLKEYRTVPLVWVGNTNYACTVIYGYIKDWSVPVATRGKAIMALEIEGIT